MHWGPSPLHSWWPMSSAPPCLPITGVLSKQTAGEEEALKQKGSGHLLALQQECPRPIRLAQADLPIHPKYRGCPGLRPHSLGERESPWCSPILTVAHQLGHPCPPASHPSQAQRLGRMQSVIRTLLPRPGRCSEEKLAKS